MIKILKWIWKKMIEIGNYVITAITIGSTTPNQIDVGDTQVWPDGGPSPTSHTYTFAVTASTDNVGYNGGTLVFNVTSKCDGVRQPLTCAVQEQGQTPDWVTFLQSATSQTYDYVFYYGIKSNSGSVRHAGFTFTQDGSGNQVQKSVTQQAYTSAFDGLTIKANTSSQYGNWVVGTIVTGNGGPGAGYPMLGVVIACDQPITGTRRITYTLTNLSRLKNLGAPQSGTSEITKTLTQTISAGAQVTPISGGKTYYGAYAILSDTSFTNGEWVTTTGTHTTLRPYPSQTLGSATITNVTTT